MPDRVVPKYVPIIELVFAKGYKTKDTTGQKRNIIFSALTGRRINRVHVAGIIENVTERETRDGTKVYRVRVNDGYSITFITMNPAIAQMASKNLGSFAEITARGFVRRDGKVGWRIEQFAVTDPENFIAVRAMSLRNLQEDLGTLDPEKINELINKALEILVDEDRVNKEFNKLLEKASAAEKKKLKKLRGRAKLEYVAKKLGIPEVFVQFADDYIEHENYVIELLEEATKEESD